MGAYSQPPSEVPPTGEKPFGWSWLRWFVDSVPSSELPSAITVGASVFTYQNTLRQNHAATIIVKGGTVTLIEFSRDNVTFYDYGVIAGAFYLDYLDYIRVTYAVVPTMTHISR